MTTFRSKPYTAVYDPASLTCETCEHCGAEKREYAYQVNRSMVQFMEILAAHGKPAMKKELKLPNGPALNGQRAYLWGLIVSDGTTNRGPWRITDRGTRFLAGQENIPQYVIVVTSATKDKGTVTRYAGKMCSATEVRHRVGTDQDFEDTAQEKRGARQRSI